MNKKQARKILQEMENLSEVIIGGLRIAKIFNTYAISHDTNPQKDFYGDCDTFTYGYKLSWVLNTLLSEGGIKYE